MGKFITIEICDELIICKPCYDYKILRCIFIFQSHLMQIKHFAFLLAIACIITACKKADQQPSAPADVKKIGQVYSGGGNSLYCMDLNQVTSTEAAGFTIASGVPYYDNGVIYTCNMYGVTAFEEKNLSVIWTIKYASTNYTNNSLQYNCSPIIRDSIIYCMGFTGLGGRISLYAFNKKSGAAIWSRVLTQQFESIIPMPIIAKDKILVTSPDWDYNKSPVMCFNRFTGSVVWEKNFRSEGIGPYKYPQTDGNSIFFSNVYAPTLYSYDVNTGEKNWERTLPFKINPSTRPIVKGKNIYLLSDSEGSGKTSVFILDKESGIIKKTHISFDNIRSITADEEIFYTFTSYGYHAINSNTLSEIWNVKSHYRTYRDSALQTGNGCVPWFFLGHMVDGDTHLIHYIKEYCTNNCLYSGFVFVNKKTGKIDKIVDSRKLCEGPVSPGFLYVEEGKGYYPSIGG